MLLLNRATFFHCNGLQQNEFLRKIVPSFWFFFCGVLSPFFHRFAAIVIFFYSNSAFAFLGMCVILLITFSNLLSMFASGYGNNIFHNVDVNIFNPVNMRNDSPPCLVYFLFFVHFCDNSSFYCKSNDKFTIGSLQMYLTLICL